MLRGDVNPYPILHLINYWENRPTSIGSHLDELQKRGISEVGSFVPWQAAESDIFHTLSRLLQCAAERKMRLFLFLTPELGVHYLNSGLPKDIASRKDVRALDAQNGLIPVILPPHIFYLPTYFSSQMSKRYYGFIARMDNYIADLAKSQPSLVKGLTVVVTGSYWKYYRSPVSSSQAVFGGTAGDYSSHAALAYRQRLEHFYSQKEFLDPTPAAANKWKTRSIEEVNRRWFYQNSEDVFRNRTLQTLKRKTPTLPISEIELATPEVDPGLAYSKVLEGLSAGHVDFPRLSMILDEYACRMSRGSHGLAPTYLHWTSMGGFSRLLDAEKQFLLFKSLLLFGGNSGGLTLESAEWGGLSHSFRNRLDQLARLFSYGDLEFSNRAFYLVPHLWSNYGNLWEELAREVGNEAKIVASLDVVIAHSSSRLLVVDPSVIITREMVLKLLNWAQGGRVLVLPRTPLYTEAAQRELSKAIDVSKRMEVDMGFQSELYPLGDGKLIAYEIPGHLSLRGEPLSSLNVFVKAAISVSGIERSCYLTDEKLLAVAFEYKREKLALFVLNGTQRPVQADLVFSKPVQVGDFAGILTGGQAGENPQAASPATRFSLDVPAYGILPLAVEGLNLAEAHDQFLANQTAQQTRRNVISGAESQLSGFDSEEGIEEVWK